MIQQLVDENLDHVVGVRREVEGCKNGRRTAPTTRTGNKVLNRIVAGIFGDSMGDMLSGYRVFSRRFVKSFPAVSREFEIETELTVHSLALRIPSDVGAGRLQGPRRGQRVQAAHLPRRLADPERDHQPDPPRAPDVLLRPPRRPLRPARAGARRAGRWSPTSRPAWCRSFPSLFVASFLLVISCLGLMAGLVLDGIRKSRHEASRLSYMRHPADPRRLRPRPRSPAAR